MADSMSHPWLRWPEDDDLEEDVAVDEHWRAAEQAEALVELSSLLRRVVTRGLRAKDRMRWALRLAAGEDAGTIAAEHGLSAAYVSGSARWALHCLAHAAVDADAWRAYTDSWKRWRVFRGYMGEVPDSPVPSVPKRWSR